MSWRERLEAAITAAHPRCVECGNDHVTVEDRPGLGGEIPVSRHWAANGPGECCPVLAGGLAAARCHDDLWTALEATGLIPVGDYGEVAWARRELVSV